MREIEVILTSFEEGTSFLADEHPIVNDSDYCEIVTTPNVLNYTYDGCDCHIKGNEPIEQLIDEMKSTIIFNRWFEENWMKNFSDFGIEGLIVYDFEEDDFFKVDSIDQFANNCTHEDGFDELMDELQQIAEKEFSVKVIDLS